MDGVAAGVSSMRDACRSGWRNKYGRRTAQRSSRAPDLFELEDSVDFDRYAKRQLLHANRGSGMTARVAKDFDHHIGRAVRDLRLFHETTVGSHEHVELHAPRHTVKVANRSLRLGDDIQSTNARRLVAVFNRNFLTERADVEELALPAGDLACNIDLIASDDEGHVICNGGRRIGQFYF